MNYKIVFLKMCFSAKNQLFTELYKTGLDGAKCDLADPLWSFLRKDFEIFEEVTNFPFILGSI